MSALTATYKNRQKVLGYPVDMVSEQSALEIIGEAWSNGKSLHVVTINAEMVVTAQRDQQLDRIIRHAHLIVPDGSGVVFALKLIGQTVSKLPGIELAAATLREAAKTNRRIALLGGKPEVMEKLQRVLIEQYPGINIVASHDGYWSSDTEDEVVDALSAAEPDLLLVAMGVPRQEYFLDRWHAAFPHAVMIGVGGSFDVWTGAVKRAPALFRKLHLEWLYRLLAEPWRYKRIGSALPSFAIQVLAETARNNMQADSKHGERRNSKRHNNHDKSKERSKEK
ncbi:MAG TPA: WecB/TagA/CpsF family glycosyltransferase [Oculatellaceae cyanobacterium]